VEEEVREKLERIERHLLALYERTSPQLPLVVRRDHAARLLDVSPSTVKGMIRRGEIIPTQVSGRQMVPTSEIIRLATPRVVAALMSKPIGARAAKTVARTEAEKIRAAMRKSRKKF
jgi:hypothetical protein